MTERLKLSDVVAQRKITDYNSAINSIAHTDMQLAVKVAALSKELEEYTALRVKIAQAGDSTETEVETIYELARAASALLYPNWNTGTVINGDKIVTGSITAARLTANSIACNTITASKLG